MTYLNSISVKNNSAVYLKDIPVSDYNGLCNFFRSYLIAEDAHCVNYFTVPIDNGFKLFSCIARDLTSEILISSCEVEKGKHITSLIREFPSLHVYEREIAETTGMVFEGSTWDKPLRYPHDRLYKEITVDNYPYFDVKSEELHQVGVGPIHAGIIEPGHFRFICNGEKVLHLEIKLGYQHRGVEYLMRTNQNRLYQVKLAESIAGDTVIGNNLCYSQVIESLSSYTPSDNVNIERAVALELERIAIHTGDLSALCTDIAYQLGNTVLQGLRTIIINSFLNWCGNRFGRNLIFPGKNVFPLSDEKKKTLLSVLDIYEKKFNEVIFLIFDLPGVLARFEKTGIVTQEQAVMMQFTGMAARTSGLGRDIRTSHPTGAYVTNPIKSHTLTTGDVMARAYLRKLEVTTSIGHIRSLLTLHSEEMTGTNNNKTQPDSLAISLVEGWRGEICHTAITGADGQISWYKIKDPSLHNWFALALAVRNNDISDFPVCNKSFNLSYCGYDL